ncbi:MAG: MBL fold metallo-hydrolase [Pseudomonadota bacterium]
MPVAIDEIVKISMNMDRLTITILVDNQVGNGLIAEHGLSIWIETQGKRILFDTGQGGALAQNSQALGKDLGKTDILVLSHGHYDHTGGIPQILQNARGIEVYCHPGVVQPRYAIRDSNVRPIHMSSESMLAINNLPIKYLHWITQPVFLSHWVGLTGSIPRETSYEDTGGPFYLDSEGVRADPIEDDLALWIRVDDGLVVCAGCCHAGIVNTLNHIQRLNNGLRIKAVIGGFHLLNASKGRLNQTIAALRFLDLDRVIPCHCTGEQAVTELSNALGDMVVSHGAAGMSFHYPL